MKAFYLLSFLLSAALGVQSQNTTWQAPLDLDLHQSQRTRFHLSENDRTFSACVGSFLTELDHFGNSTNQLNLVEGPGVWLLKTPIAYFESSRRKVVVSTYSNGQDETIFVEAFRSSREISSLILNDQIPADLSAGPAALLTHDGQLIVFGNTTIFRCQLNADASLELIEELANPFGSVVAALPFNGGFAAAKSSGEIAFFDANLTVIREVVLPNSRITSLSANNERLFIAGQRNAESLLAALNTNGQVLFNRTQAGAFAFENLSVSKTGDRIAAVGLSTDSTGFLRTFDEAGNVQFTELFPQTRGLLSVLYGTYEGFIIGGLLPSGDAVLLKTDDRGNTSDIIDPYAPTKLTTELIGIGNSVLSGGITTESGFQEGDFSYPRDSSTTTLFSLGLFASAVDSTGLKYFIGNRYGDITEWAPGFFDSPDEIQAYRRGWLITQAAIDIQQADLLDGRKDLPWSEDLISWPATRNKRFFHQGQQVQILHEGAPFVDVNQDGIYDAYDGDHPIIKGEQMLWLTFHNPLTISPMHLQIQGTAYTLNTDDNALLERTIFVDYEITNKTDTDFDSLRITLFADLDIGCYLDDHIGSYPEKNTVYSYNSTVTDQNPCSGVSSFNQNSPVQSISFLNQDLTSAIATAKADFNDPQPPTQISSIGGFLTLSNIHNGLWADGTPITREGTGYNPNGSAPTTRYMFDGNPADPADWSMCTADSADYEWLWYMNGELSTLAPAETQSLKIALITHPDVPLPCIDREDLDPALDLINDCYSIYGAQSPIDLGFDWFSDYIPFDYFIGTEVPGATYLWSTGDTTALIEVPGPGRFFVQVTTAEGCVYSDDIYFGLVASTSQQPITTKTINVFPNPTTGIITLQNKNERPLSGNYRIFSLTGKLIQRGKLPQVASFEVSLAEQPTGIYFLHVQTNQKTEVLKIIKN